MQISSLVRNRGQVLPIAVVGLVIGCTVLLLMYNSGQKITDKTVVANAADASAYSAGIWTARHLNFMAYTNRAMIANHVGTGHFISYVGWIRYIENSLDSLEKIAGWIPYVGAAIRVAETYAERLADINEETAPIVTQGIDLLNGIYSAAQVEAQAGLTYFRLNKIMEETARVYDPDIKVNEISGMSALPLAVRATLTGRIAAQRAQIPTFVESFEPGSDDEGEISALVTRSYGSSQRWIAGNRGWKENFLVVKIHKTGSTTHTDDELTDWESTDRLSFATLEWDGWDWSTLAKGKATAREFHDDYRGIRRYYNLSEDDSGKDEGLYITVYATKRQEQTRTENLLPLSRTDEQAASPLNASSTALVAFTQPIKNFGTSREEYGSLYNPFWEPRLVNRPNVAGF